MTDLDPAGLEGSATDGSTDLDDRDVKALTEYLTALPEAPGLYTVVSQSGREYTVDVETGACTCPDAEYNLPTDDGRELCKHAARVRYELGERPLPAWIDRDALPSDFGAHVDGAPRVAATDGGEIVVAGDEGEILEDDRPDDCTCHPAWRADAPPCWPCYRRGFREPNPDAEGV